MRTLSNPAVRWDGFVEFDDRPYFLTIMKFYLIYPFSFFPLYSSSGRNYAKIWTIFVESVETSIQRWMWNLKIYDVRLSEIPDSEMTTSLNTSPFSDFSKINPLKDFSGSALTRFLLSEDFLLKLLHYRIRQMIAQSTPLDE